MKRKITELREPADLQNAPTVDEYLRRYELPGSSPTMFGHLLADICRRITALEAAVRAVHDAEEAQ